MATVTVTSARFIHIGPFTLKVWENDEELEYDTIDEARSVFDD